MSDAEKLLLEELRAQNWELRADYIKLEEITNHIVATADELIRLYKIELDRLKPGK